MGRGGCPYCGSPKDGKESDWMDFQGLKLKVVHYSCGSQLNLTRSGIKYSGKFDNRCSLIEKTKEQD